MFSLFFFFFFFDSVRDRLVYISEWMSCCEHIGFSFFRSSGRSPNSHVAYGVYADWAGYGFTTVHNRSLRTVWTASEFNCSTQHVVAISSGEAELYATGRAAAERGLQSVQLLADAGMELKLEVLTDSTANLGMHHLTRHLDVKWLCTQEAVQAGRFSLKEVGTCSTVSDPTTKHHDEERVKVLMTWERLRYTEDTRDAVSTAKAGQPW